jgi:hypothetical protein
VIRPRCCASKVCEGNEAGLGPAPGEGKRMVDQISSWTGFSSIAFSSARNSAA